ncbi:hypothetical protein NE237_030093 [Protea cynaroides]|uniref:Uncharacterized protein n=1 Tax=Protea cynaroides TaxID=273540 RepID=A0A9Q0GUE9_9MAGN|nr:hypothetical protein NE237_030093 [Protea cynaroides]
MLPLVDYEEMYRSSKAPFPFWVSARSQLMERKTFANRSKDYRTHQRSPFRNFIILDLSLACNPSSKFEFSKQLTPGKDQKSLLENFGLRYRRKTGFLKEECD